MPRPLRTIRRRHHEIRYHAASRPDTPWHRWRDRLLLLAVPLALPATLLLEATVHRPEVLTQVNGGLVGPAGGPYRAGLQLDEEAGIDWPDGRRQGIFQLRIEDRFDGWPLTSSITRGIVALDLDFYEESSRRRDVEPPADSPVGEAIIAALDDPEVTFDLPEPVPAVVRRWRDTGALPPQLERRRYWPGMIAALATSWLGLSLLAVTGVATARYAWTIATQARDVRRDRMRRRGQCSECGFDLRGNLFTDRCPECGARSD